MLLDLSLLILFPRLPPVRAHAPAVHTGSPPNVGQPRHRRREACGAAGAPDAVRCRETESPAEMASLGRVGGRLRGSEERVMPFHWPLRSRAGLVCLFPSIDAFRGARTSGPEHRVDFAFCSSRGNPKLLLFGAQKIRCHARGQKKAGKSREKCPGNGCNRGSWLTTDLTAAGATEARKCTD